MALGLTEEPEAATLARAAMDASRLAIGAGDAVCALRWLDRAHRLLPRDPNIALALAGACLSSETARSAQLFAEVSGQHDVREAWVGLAAARLRLGAAEEARAALANALSRHVPRPDSQRIALDIVRATGGFGWCGLGFTGDLIVHAVGDPTPVITLDDRRQTPGKRLPPDWIRASTLSVTVRGAHLIGSPIDIAAIRRTEGVVTAHPGGLSGWAWHKADPGRPVALRIVDEQGRGLDATADDASIIVPDLGPLARPLGFSLPAHALGRLGTVLRVETTDGSALYGSPVAPLAALRSAADCARTIAAHYPLVTVAPLDSPSPMTPLPADLPLPDRPVGVGRPSAATTVIIPVHNQAALVRTCLDSVLDTVAAPHRVMVIDDASTDPALAEFLNDLVRARRITLLRNPKNLGFAGSVNRGLRASRGRDVVLLNSDTIVPPRWLDRLRDAAHGAPDIGSVTPLSNDATILSYPDRSAANPAPDRAGTIRLDTAARAVAGSATVDIPVGVGFCLFIRRDCLDAVGVLREDVFAQGYGEENDWCLRARRLGWRHVALPGLFVAHQGGRSFNGAGSHLRTRNAALLEHLHPGYGALVQDHVRADPLAPIRRKLDQRRWRARHGDRRDSVILVTHDDAGGVEQRIRLAIGAHAEQGRSAIILRPARGADSAPAVEAGSAERFPNLRFAMPDEMPALLRWLRQQRPVLVELHHFLGHHKALHDLPASLGVPCHVHVHDYAWFCPRVSLVDGHGRYCGEPDLRACEACVADHGRLDHDDTPVAALRSRSAGLLERAARVIVPSADTASRIMRHFPRIRPMVVPHQDDLAIPPAPRRPVRADRRFKVCVLGGIGTHKGYQVLLDCARDAAARDLGIEFVVVGSTIDDARLMATGRVFITGSYDAADAVDLVMRQDADLGFLPSIWPETWCMGLTELWRAGLQVAAFDIGAPAERIRRTGRGFLLPPHLPPGAINTMLANLMAPSVPLGLSAVKRNVPQADLSHPADKGP